MWTKLIEGQPPRCERMTGLSREQVDRLHAELDLILDWQSPLGRPKVLPLYTALVMVLFQLRHNLPEDACAEVFGCATATVWRYQEQLEPLIEAILDEFAAQARSRAQSAAVLVDGFIAPVGERDDTTGLFSDKKHLSGQNVQVVATLGGRVVDVGDPCPGARHDSKAFVDSGLAARWADHYASGGPGMIGDKGYQGTGLTTPYRKPPGRDLTDVRRACNTAINRIRAAVERAIAHLKNWKILKTGYRRSLHDFPRVLRTVTKLEIYRWSTRPF
ncbi:IS5/IS1182 family transposase [Micromonospora zhanjiangensis]